MTEWVEVQPDWEKGIEQFKVGDRVRVYSGNSSADGMIERIGGKYPVLVVKFKHCLLRDEFHWKQCALLKKREPREFWISESPKGFFALHMHGPWSAKSRFIPDSTWFRVREVLGEGE